MTDHATPRRTFLGQLALTTAGLTGVAHAGTLSATPGPNAAPWDDSWTTRLGSSHRFVFDVPQQTDAVFSQLTSLYGDYATAIDAKDRDMHVVVVIRHAAIAMIFGDSLWSKYKIGDSNPARAALASWQARGVTVLACNMALMNRVRNFAHDSGADQGAVEAEVRANVLPGVILQVNGVYAVLRAQDAGCVLYHGG
jgi:intracellular sulfur oxidation DsrE/DsrF family protein